MNDKLDQILTELNRMSMQGVWFVEARPALEQFLSTSTQQAVIAELDNLADYDQTEEDLETKLHDRIIELELKSQLDSSKTGEKMRDDSE